MGRRGPQILTPKQEHALEKVRKLDDDYRVAQKAIAAKVRTEIALQLAAYEQNRDDAVYEAALLGVPVVRIATDGLGTSSTNKVYQVIHDHAARMSLDLPERPEVPRFSWHDPERKNGAWLAWVWDDDSTDNPVHSGAGPVPWFGTGWAFALFDGQRNAGWKLYPGQVDPPEGLLEFVRDNPLDPKEEARP